MGNHALNTVFWLELDGIGVDLPQFQMFLFFVCRLKIGMVYHIFLRIYPKAVKKKSLFAVRQGQELESPNLDPVDFFWVKTYSTI